MSVARARAELKDVPPNASYQEREIAFKKMFSAFKKQCTDAGIQHSYKQHEHYETPGERRRRKARESEVARLKAKLKENFPEKKGAQQYE
jgi:ribosomal protein S21